MTTRRSLPRVRTVVPALFLLTALIVSTSCGGSHRAAPSRTDTSQRTTARRTVPSEPKYSHLALISARSGDVLKISDLAVTSAVADGRGGWFVSGDIGLARMLPNGKLDSSWGAPGLRKIKNCGPLIKSGSRLYLAKWRDIAASTEGTAPQNSTTGENGACVIGAFDAATGKPLWVSKQLFSQSRVLELVASSTRVYAGGNFSTVGESERQGLAAFDAETGRLLDWHTPRFRFDPPTSPLVSALTLAGSRLYVGGLFSSIGGKQRYYLAALNPSTGALLPWQPPKALGGAYYPLQILVTRGQLIVPGYDAFVAVNLRTGQEPAWRSDASTVVADGKLLYLGGNIERTLGPTADTGYNLAALNLKTQNYTSWAPDLGFKYVDVGEIIPSGKQVLVVGDFTNFIG